MKITKMKKWSFSIIGALIISIVLRYLLSFGNDVIDITEQVNISSNSIAILVFILSVFVFIRTFKHLEKKQRQEGKDKFGQEN